MLKLNYKSEYDKRIDSECIPLLNALNSLPDLHTHGSCCGHGKYPFTVWFTCNNPITLRFLGRCLDRRYWQYGNNWRIILDNIDTNYNDTCYSLESQGIWGNKLIQAKGEDAYLQSNDLIKNMEDHLNNSAYFSAFIGNLEGFNVADVN